LSIIRARFPDYLEPAKKRGQYICPLCGHGKGGDGLSVVPPSKGGDGSRLHCFGCGFHGDLLDLFAREHGLRWREAFLQLCRVFSLQVQREVRVRAKAPDPRGGEPRGLDLPAAKAYLERRGISVETARAYGVGFREDWVSPAAVRSLREQGRDWTPPASPRMIIPTSEGGYTARDIREDADPRFRKMKEGPAGLFNPGALRNRAGRPVFIVEGEFDALSVLEAGGLAVALGSVSNRGRLLELVRADKPSGPLILSLDNDQAGQDASISLSEALEGLSVPFVVIDICLGCKDPSEALQTKREGFVHAVREAERMSGARPDSVGFYLSRLMGGELRAFRDGSRRRTGFDSLDDEAGGIYPGLYVLGAISSLGKTTLLHQIADQMASMGEHVLYFSLEQSRLELVTKSIARNAAQRAGRGCFSSLDIRTGRVPEGALQGLREAFNAYREQIGGRLSIIEGDFGCSVSFIKEYAGRYAESNHVRPVVVVDYLQILQGDLRQRSGARELVDTNVTGLKRLSRDMELPVFVVSSVNRANYLTPIDFESFKESGGIEYTADVVWGLQLSVLDNELFSREGRLREKRDMIRRAKASDPRRVDLVCLKNRYGVSSYRVPFEYLPRCDWFRELPRDSVEDHRL